MYGRGKKKTKKNELLYESLINDNMRKHYGFTYTVRGKG